MPLLIGGATTSRVHTAVKIDPHYAPASCTCCDASRAVGVVGKLMQRAHARRARWPGASRTSTRAAGRGERRERGPSRGPADPGRGRGPRLRLDWAAHTADAAGPAGIHVWRRRTWRHCAGSSTGRRSSRPGACRASTRAILDDARLGAEARRLFADAQEMLDAGAEPAARCGRAASGACCRRPPTATTWCSSPTTAHGRTGRACRSCGSSARSAAGRPNLCLTDFVAPAARGRGRLGGCLRGDRRPGRGRPGAALRTGGRRLPRHPGRSRWPTAWPRPSPSSCT